ncbi:MAG: hypothetical protein IJR19_07625, partial [Lachnospiraceae bacterium]|nr:hypothetical protein [Lachnospiraceae bacterium]
DKYREAAPDYYSADKKAFVIHDGKLEILNALEWGTYFFEEVEGPAGYVFESGKIRTADFTVSAEDMVEDSKKIRSMTVHDLTLENEKIKGYVYLEKSFTAVDENMNKLTNYSGIQFKLSRKTGEDTWEDLTDEDGNTRLFTTDKEGKISAEQIGELEFGTYRFEEVSLEGTAAEAAGYALNTEPSQEFSISSVNTVATAYKVSFVNSAISGSVHFDKKDEKGTMIPGIGFNLYLLKDEENEAYENSKPYKYEVSTETGVDFTNIPKGEYFLVEDAASAEALGYKADDTHYYFTISEQGERAKVYKKNAEGELKELENRTIINTEIRLGRISLIKYVETENGTKPADISKAGFVLKNAETDEIVSITDENGVVITYNEEELRRHVSEDKSTITVEVEKGSYYFEEVSPVPGYAIAGDGRTETVVVNAGNINETLTTPETVSLTNNKIKVYFSKKDLENHEINSQGGVIELYGPFDTQTGYTLENEKLLKSWDISAADVELRISDDANDTVGFTNGFVAGKSYVLHEAHSPEGYTATRDVVFTVNNTGNVSLSENNTAGTEEKPANAGIQKHNSGYQMIIMKDAPTEITISKRVMADEEANRTLIKSGIGGKLVLLEYNDNTKKVVENNGKVALSDIDKDDIIESFAIDGNEHTISNKLSTGEDHKYILWEAETPKGYYTANPIVFWLDGSGTIQVEDNTNDPHMEGLGTTTLTMLDRPIEYRISKLLIGTTESSNPVYVKDATLNIYKDNGENVSGPARFTHVHTIEHTSGGEDVIPAGKLEAGCKYVITEKEVPEGFIVSAIQDEKVNNEPVIGEFTVKQFDYDKRLVSNGVTNVLDQSTKVVNDYLKVVISKKALNGAGAGELSGAELKIVDNSEDAKNILYDGLQTITTDGRAIWLVDTEMLKNSEGALDQVKQFAEAAGARIVGARLTKGHSYTITEVNAPDGYAKTSVGFVINADGSVRMQGETASVVRVVDPELEVAFDKVSLKGAGSGEERLKGATLQLKRGDTVVAEWESGDLPVIITEAEADEEGLIKVGNVSYRKLTSDEIMEDGFKLEAGVEYVLHEKKAPAKYYLAEDIKFKLSDEGDDPDTRANINHHIIKMTDYAEGETHLEVRKKWNVPEDEDDFEFPDEIFIEVRRRSAGTDEESKLYGRYMIPKVTQGTGADNHGEVSHDKNGAVVSITGIENAFRTNKNGAAAILKITGLKEYDEKGRKYEYSVTESFSEGYGEYTAAPAVETFAENGYVELTNTLNEWPNTDITVTKRWEVYRNFDGKLITDPIEDVTLNLRRTSSGERNPEKDEIVATKKIEKSDYDTFAEYGFRFSEYTEGADKGKPLPKYDTNDGENYGKRYDYYVTED